MPNESREQGGPSTLDKVTIYLDTYEGISGSKPGVLLGLAAGAGVGLLARVGIDSMFVTNAEYRSQIQDIDELQQHHSNLIATAHILEQNNAQTQANVLLKKAKAYTTEITQAKSNLPQGYQPHLEGLADFGGFAVSWIFVGTAIYKGIKYRANRGRTRVAALAESTG